MTCVRSGGWIAWLGATSHACGRLASVGRHEQDEAPAQVKNYAYVQTAIIGWYSRLGSWARVEAHAILGEDVSTKDEVHLNGAVVLPHKELKESVPEPRIIM